jgi:hypothetical protein
MSTQSTLRACSFAATAALLCPPVLGGWRGMRGAA